jgi:hypothetical protein
MGILKNTTEGISYPLRPYQRDLLDKLASGGFQAGEMAIIAAGRQTGKSYYKMLLNQAYGSVSIMLPKFEIVAKAQVDGDTWYTVACNREVSAWIREQPKEWQYTNTDQRWFTTNIDVHEKLYTMMALRWS